MAMWVMLIASFIRGITGFGLGLFLAPFLVLIMEPKASVAVILLMVELSHIVTLTFGYRAVNIRRLLPMIAGSLLGVPIGVSIIVMISASVLKLLIGGVVVLIAILMVFKFTPRFPNERLASGIAGLLCGIFTPSVGLGGPPVIFFMHTQDWGKDEIYQNLALFFLISTTMSLIGLACSGIITPAVLLTFISLAPGLIIGVCLGMFTFRRVNPSYFRMASMFVIVCGGILATLAGLGIVK